MMDRQGELFLTPQEKRDMIEQADFGLIGVGRKAWAKVRALLWAIETTPEESRIADVLSGKMVLGMKTGVACSTYREALKLAQQLDPCPLVIQEQRGKPNRMAVDWAGLKKWAGGSPRLSAPHRKKSEGSENNQRGPKIIGGVRFFSEGSENSNPSGIPEVSEVACSNLQQPENPPPKQGKELRTPDPTGQNEKGSEKKKALPWSKLVGRDLTRDDLSDPAILKRAHQAALQAGGRVGAGESGLISFFAMARCAWRLGKVSPPGLLHSAIFGGSKLGPTPADEAWARQMLAPPTPRPETAQPASTRLAARLGVPIEPRESFNPPARRSPAEQQLELQRRLAGSRAGP